MVVHWDVESLTESAECGRTRQSFNISGTTFDSDIAYKDYEQIITGAGLNHTAKVAAPAPQPVKFQTYYVRKGDTLTAIDKQIRTTIQQIAVDNNIKNVELIHAAQPLEDKMLKVCSTAVENTRSRSMHGSRLNIKQGTMTGTQDHAYQFRQRAAGRKKSKQIREDAQYLCEVCRDKKKLVYEGFSVHHITPLNEDASIGYEDTNLICLCSTRHELAEVGMIDREYLRRLTAWEYQGSVEQSPLYAGIFQFARHLTPLMLHIAKDLLENDL